MLAHMPARSKALKNHLKTTLDKAATYCGDDVRLFFERNHHYKLRMIPTIPQGIHNCVCSPVRREYAKSPYRRKILHGYPCPQLQAQTQNLPIILAFQSATHYSHHPACKSLPLPLPTPRSQASAHAEIPAKRHIRIPHHR